ncbi:MAG: hypothetical protein Kow00129_15360 [Thermoleophilia bacterium]
MLVGVADLKLQLEAMVAYGGLHVGVPGLVSEIEQYGVLFHVTKAVEERSPWERAFFGYALSVHNKLESRLHADLSVPLTCLILAK